MAVGKAEVLAGLEGVKSPEGTPLPKTGKLSDIVVSDGKVFFSITVDAAVVQRWETVRKAAEAAVRAVPGAPGGAAVPPSPHAGRGRPAAHAGDGQPAVPGVGAIIAVASGKGGV